MILTIIKIQSILLIVSINPTSSLIGTNGMQVTEVIGRAGEVSARCAFTVHQRGPEGPEVRGHFGEGETGAH